MVHCEVQVQVLVIYETNVQVQMLANCSSCQKVVKMLVYFIMHGLSANFNKKRF
jgi:hypothetical protein